MLGRNVLGAALGGDGAGARELVARAVREGHVVGSHTMTHVRSLTDQELEQELEECDRLIADAYVRCARGAPVSIPVRLPFGNFRDDHPRAMERLEHIGRPHCHWTAAFGDWEPDCTAEAIAAAIRAHVTWQWANRRTPVLLLHDAGQGAIGGGEMFGVGRAATVAAVDLVCAWLRSKEAVFQTVLEVAGDGLRFDLAGPGTS